MWLIVTVLPAPEGPSSTVISPGGTSRSIRCRTCALPKRFSTPISSTARSGFGSTAITPSLCPLPSAAMRIDELLATQRPVFSVEFFPPKTETGLELLFETVEALKPLEPDYVSITYGAGGATRDGTVEIAERIKTDHWPEVMAHR